MLVVNIFAFVLLTWKSLSVSATCWGDKRRSQSGKVQLPI